MRRDMSGVGFVMNALRTNILHIRRRAVYMEHRQQQQRQVNRQKHSCCPNLFTFHVHGCKVTKKREIFPPFAFFFIFF